MNAHCEIIMTSKQLPTQSVDTLEGLIIKDKYGNKYKGHILSNHPEMIESCVSFICDEFTNGDRDDADPLLIVNKDIKKYGQEFCFWAKEYFGKLSKLNKLHLTFYLTDMKTNELVHVVFCNDLYDDDMHFTDDEYNKIKPNMPALANEYAILDELAENGVENLLTKITKDEIEKKKELRMKNVFCNAFLATTSEKYTECGIVSIGYVFVLKYIKSLGFKYIGQTTTNPKIQYILKKYFNAICYDKVKICDHFPDWDCSGKVSKDQVLMYQIVDLNNPLLGAIFGNVNLLSKL